MIFVQASRVNSENIVETKCDVSLYYTKFKHQPIGFILTNME